MAEDQDPVPGEGSSEGEEVSRQRRKWMLGAAAGASALALVALYGFRHTLFGGGGQGDQPSDAQARALEGIASSFMRQFNLPGLSVAIARHGRMAYQAAFGYANENRMERTTPDSLFRIASVSKPVTAIAVFKLIEQGRLALSDKVFGSGGRLAQYGNALPALGGITVHHLLTHTSGAWSNESRDPMFEQPEMNHAELIAWTLENFPPNSPPGVRHAYSNFGYCLLGRIIEEASGMPYADYVQQEVLGPSGVKEMRIGGNRIADRVPGEVVYYGGEGGENAYGMNVARMDAHGGWIASATDLVRLAMHVDGFRFTPNILTEKSIAAMTHPAAPSGYYACGWAVDGGNWWHAGSLPGTSSLLVRTASGLCWAALANMRAPGIDEALDNMMWNMARAVPAWRA